MSLRLCVLLLLLLAAGASPAGATSLSVSPIGIERVAPAAAASLTLRNTGDRPINVQVRVFRWTQQGGNDRLDPTREVAVSPPMTALAPGVDYTVRVVRVSKAPVQGEESYRVFVDELPDRSAGGANAVQLLTRYSIPVFFRTRDAADDDVAWQAAIQGRRVALTATNSGDRRFKVGRLVLRDSSGHEFELSAGLLGYVLGASTMAWTLTAPGERRPQPGPAELTIISDGDTSHVPITLRVGG